MSYTPPPSARPFTLHIPDQDLSDWRQLLTLSNLGPKTYKNTYINSFPNYKTTIDDIDVHFVGLFSSKKDAVPIMFLHGWPGSFIEFLPMLEPVKKKWEGKELPYQFVVPSLPGYTLSSRGPAERDWSMMDTAAVMEKLMRGLGFDKYFVQGGDVGSMVARVMSAMFGSVVGVHLNMFMASAAPDPSKLSPLEQRAVENATKWCEIGTAYAQEHGTRPSTIGHVLSSNPLAMLAWIGEKFLEWLDPATIPSLDNPHRRVPILLHQLLPTSLYPYRASFRGPRMQVPPLTKPTGYSFFPHELFPGGGHFAALEKPAELWGDVEEFVGTVLNGKGGKL
ncbi:epoxide hydrolase-like protein [Bimuria novae-zelandiae CBS 107.79]|uniref:Epoxide hydrolase-like protein n=1 Tax=Bimuria novae-zelandiae CBS 107.79 TaxID=1447943 RepID=A0A6A5VCN9_9PLEO|nr:epoxide hydrolase-like protein [Bimuria novae-zelandiae CBS 107.79]